MKSKFRRIKAQSGTSFTNAVNLDEGPMADAMMDWNINMQGASPVNKVLSKDNIPVTDVYDSQGNKIGVTDSSGNITRTTGNATSKSGINPSWYVDGFNAAASAVTGVANMIQNNRLKDQEQQQVLHSLEPRYWQNMEGEGLNNLPMYTKYGGRRKYAAGGKKQTGGNIGRKVDVLPSGYDFDRVDTSGAKVYKRNIAGDLPMAKPTEKQGSPQFEAFLKKQLESGVPVETLIKNKYIAPERAKDYQQYYKPQVDYVHMVDQQPPVAKPVDPYSNWSRDKNMIHFNDRAVAEMWYPTSQTNDVTTQGGKPTAAQPGMLRFRNDWGYTGDELPLDAPEIQKYLGTGQAIDDQEKYDALLNAAKKRAAAKTQSNTGKLQAGGGLDELYGLPDGMIQFADVEAEAGEVMEMQDGGFVKVADDGNTHEEGGENIAGVKRVLEDTARKRKDPASKMLVVQPDVVEQVFGFRPKTATSHAKVFQLVKEELAKTNKMYSNANKGANMLPEMNKVTMNSLRLNDMFQGELPTEDEVFELLFNHQEGIKAENNINDDGSMAQYGGNIRKAQAGVSEYKGGKTKQGSITPAGNPNAFNYPGGLDAFKKAWSGFLDLSQYKTVAEAQAATYDYLVKNQPDVAASIWQSQGLTAKGKKLMQSDPNFAKVAKDVFNADGTIKQGVKPTPEQLAVLTPAYADNMLGVRAITPSQMTTSSEEVTPGSAPVQEPKQRTVLNPGVTINPKFVQQPENQFFEPTYWSDIAAPLAGLVDSFRRDPELYSPQTFHQLRYKLLDPTAALTANQADFNAIAGEADAATKSGLIAQKYRANNQVLSQYDQQNAGIKNNEVTYNTQVRDRQSAADAQAREKFYRNVQLGREAQRQQYLTSLGQISRVDQLKRRQNNSGNLIMKLSPAFDQYGEYNGYQYVPYLDPSMLQYDETPVKPGKPSTSKTKTRTITSFKDAAGRTIQQVTAE